MNHRLLYRIYRLRARILRNMLALLSFSALISSCSSASDKQNVVTEDSLKQVEVNQRMDSVFKENEKLKAIIDSMKATDREDSIAASKKQTTIYVAPVIPVDPGPICEYGVPPVYEPDPIQDQPMYGVPVPDQILTKYGVPIPVIPDQIQTKYGIPRN